MMHTDIVNYYERIFAFSQYHHWNVNDLYDFMPWELDVMTNFLSGYLEKLELDRRHAGMGEKF